MLLAARESAVTKKPRLRLTMRRSSSVRPAGSFHSAMSRLMLISCGIQWLAQAARYFSQAHLYLKGTSWLTSALELMTCLSSTVTRRNAAPGAGSRVTRGRGAGVLSGARLSKLSMLIRSGRSVDKLRTGREGLVALGLVGLDDLPLERLAIGRRRERMDGDVEALLIVGERQPAGHPPARGRKGPLEEVRRLADEHRAVLRAVEDEQRVHRRDLAAAPFLEQERPVKLPLGEANGHSCHPASPARGAACGCSDPEPASPDSAEGR